MKPLNYYIEKILEARKGSGKQPLVGTGIKHEKRQHPHVVSNKEVSHDDMDGTDKAKGQQ